MLLSRAQDPRMARVARWLARLSNLTVGVAAILALIGWVANLETLKSILPDLVPMNPVTALAFLFAVASLWILGGIEAGPGWRSRQVAHLLALVVLLIGLQRVVGYLMGWLWVLDRWLFRSRLHGNEMAPNTAWCFIMAALALLTLDTEMGTRRLRPAVWLALIPGCIGLLTLAGYVYGVARFFSLQHLIPIALDTASCVF